MEEAIEAARIVRERETYLNTAGIHAYVDDVNQPLPSARLCSDGALVAFAQLGLMRLNAQRAFVCLLDRTYCYTVAEAIASSELRPPLNRRDDAEHGLIFCGTAVRHLLSLPSLILEAAIEHLLAGDETSSQLLPVLVVPDLQQDRRFQFLPAVAAEDSLRFCAGVPLKSRSGAIIGVFCIVDSQPRATLPSSETKSLRDLSYTIMEHLNLRHSSQDYERSTRMVRGLGSFVENSTTLSGLSEYAQHATSEGEYGREGMLNTLQQEALANPKQEASLRSATHSPSEGLDSSHKVIAKDWSDQPQQATSQAEALGKPKPIGNVESWLRTGGMAVDKPPTPDIEQDQARMETESTTSSQKTTRPENPLPLLDGVQRLFSKAANIIRESIEVEGVLFFDASVGYWGGSLESAKRHDHSETGSSTTSGASATSSSGDDSSLPTRSTIRMQKDETNCDVLGFSMTHSSSIDGMKASLGYRTVPERFLRILLRRYPAGKIFNFTEDGKPVSDTETDDDPTRATAPAEEAPARIRRKRHRSYSRSNEATLIINIFPKARSVIAFPLWDSHRERWFAGGVAWTLSPTRVFSIHGELSYLRAFGMVAMAEVARIDAQTADKSKTTLLSSISHELRTPLHGVLGGVEILQGTDIDIFQTNVIHTVETCGIMLLDTIEHLLTQSEINQSVRTAKLHRREQRTLPKQSAATRAQALVAVDTSSYVEIDAVVEQVIESMFAGHEFTHWSRPAPNPSDQDVGAPSTTAGGTAFQRCASVGSDQESVKIILDIKRAPSWAFQVDAGAVRRVVMNLFGNARKYTTSGYVKVTATQRKLSKRNAGQLAEIQIVVEDTGKGIGAEFLANHLFKPFNQEDPLNPGSGLGLSITHQIVASLEGKIEVQSTVGKGTTMSVSLPLTRPGHPLANGIFHTQTERTRGLRVSLFGFHDVVATTSYDNALEASLDWQLPRTCIERVCRDWMHMDVLVTTETSVKPDVYIATQAGARKLATMYKAGDVIQPIIVICASAMIAQDLTKLSKTLNRFEVLEYISQPCGPRKLAKTLTLCLDRWVNVQIELATQDQSPPVLATQVSGLRTLPTRTQRPPLSSIPTASSPLVLAELSPPFFSPPPELLNERQQLEHHVSPNSKPLEARSPRRGLPHGAGPISPLHVLPFLIVDDNEINLKLLSTFISRKSLPFALARDGIYAVEAYKASRGKFSCIFMDVQMPRMDGIAATRAIREYEREEKLDPVTVVALTGLATQEKQRDAEASGVNEFFSKPVRLQALTSILERTARLVQDP